MRLKTGGLILLFLIIAAGGWWGKKNWSDDDLRMSVINEKGIVLRTVSWQRRMVNELLIEPQVQVWIPKGMGWYRSGDISKVLKQENNPRLAKDILLYNFGFVPQNLTIDRTEENWGLINEIRYFFAKNEMMIKKETVSDSLSKSKENLDEILPRDFADNRMLREDIRASIYNLGQSNGLANFVASFLERAGITILGVDTADSGDKPKACQIVFGPGTDNSGVGKFIKENLGECDVKNDEGLSSGEIELYFGDGYAKMLNYDSYVGTF